jgi:hypothetical protein
LLRDLQSNFCKCLANKRKRLLDISSKPMLVTFCKKVLRLKCEFNFTENRKNGNS